MNKATVLAAVFPFLYFLHKLLYVPGLKELLLIFYPLFAFVDIYILVFLRSLSPLLLSGQRFVAEGADHAGSQPFPVRFRVPTKSEKGEERRAGT